jgi:hypothetical protein
MGIKGIEGAVRFYQGALGNVQVYHGSGNLGMPQEVFEGNDVQAFFEQVGCISVTERM